MELAATLFFNVIIAASVYALITCGLSFIYATTRVFHLAHGAVIAHSAYVFWWTARVLHWPLVIAGVAACVVAVVLGMLINECVYEPLRARKTKGLGYLIATIALLMLLNAAILPIFGAQTQSMGIQTSIFTIFGARASLLQLGLVAASVCMFIVLFWIHTRTKFGCAMRATADNEEVAEILGINTRIIRRKTFAFGSFLGGIAGILLALEFNLTPNMGVTLAIKGFAAMVVGGVGSAFGALAGSSLLSLVEQLVVYTLSLSWRDAVVFGLLFLMLLIRPSGLFGKARAL